jgi:hypothetical protein
MQAARNAGARWVDALCSSGAIAVLALCTGFVVLSAAAAQSVTPQLSAAPAAEAMPSASSAPAAAPAFNTPPIAIVPIDKSIPGAALSVAGSLQAWNGRAYLTSNGTVTAGDQTAQVTLPYRGTMKVCASSTVKLAADSSVPSSQVPGLLIALDRGALEMSFGASAAREQSADTLLTPYFRIMIGGPAAADVKVRLGRQGDTCVDNAGADAPYVVVSSVFDGGIYRVMPSQRVMFEHGSLHEVVDQEKEPCGCPPPPKAEPNEFPLAQSEGLAPIAKPPTAAIRQPAGDDQAATTLVHNSSAALPQTATIPRPEAAPAVSPTAGSGTQPPKTQKKPGFLRKIGRFFKRVFGAE